MHFLVFLVFTLGVVIAGPHAGQWLMLKAVDLSQGSSDKALTTPSITNASSTLAKNHTAPANNITSAATNPPNTASNGTAHPSGGPIPAVDTTSAPSKNVTSTCSSSGGKSVKFSDRDCWFAAKTMAEAGDAFGQCGTCVLGLYDADRKKPFKPPQTLDASVLEDQAMKLLEGCKSSDTKKVSRRDTTPSSSNNGTTNVQLLMGYNEKAKACPGL